MVLDVLLAFLASLNGFATIAMFNPRIRGIARPFGFPSGLQSNYRLIRLPGVLRTNHSSYSSCAPSQGTKEIQDFPEIFFV